MRASVGRTVAEAQGRNFGLDVLRCLAIAIVLANHAFLGFFVEAGGVAWVGKKAALSITAVLSVEWLFVLSGFLIGAMMIRGFEREGTWWTRARSFWLRRWFRTVPNYYLFLLVNVALAASVIRDDAGFKWRYVAFAQNLAWSEEWPFFYNEAWSLALDEWFYVAMPLLLLVLGFVIPSRSPQSDARRLRMRFLLATAALILLPTVMRATAELPTSIFDWDFRLRRVTVMHLDATGWGVLAAVTSRWHAGFWTKAVGAKAVAGLALTALGTLMIEQMFFGGIFSDRLLWVASTFALTCIGLGTFLCIPWVARLRAPPGRLRQGVEALSNYTYSVYLSHFPLIYVLVWAFGMPLTPAQSWIGVALWLPLVLGVSMAVHHGFEKPVSDLRERFTHRVAASPFGPAPTPTHDDPGALGLGTSHAPATPSDPIEPPKPPKPSEPPRQG